MTMRTLIAMTLRSLGLLLLLTIPALAAQAQDTTRTSVDWPGYYTGTIPCGSCPGIDTWLYLNQAGKKDFFELIETYQGNKGGTFRSAGIMKWRKDGSTVTLAPRKKQDDSRLIFVSEGFVEFLGSDGKPSKGDSDYTLRKVDAFAGNGQQLLVDPGKVVREQKNSQTQVRFPGVMNFQFRTEGGHKSLAGHFVIDCAKKDYLMPEVAYYTKDFATGKLLHSIQKNDNPALPFAGPDDVMAQAAETYCQH